MTNKMQLNGWIIEASQIDGCIRVYPVNNNEVRQCNVSASKHFTIAHIVVVDTEAKGLKMQNEVTLYHDEELDIKKAGKKEDFEVVEIKPQLF